MNRKIIITGFVTIVLTVLTSFSDTYELSRVGNEILISGTSNLHNWTISVMESNCVAEFDIDGMQLKGIKGIDFTCKVSDIKSNSNLMDRKTYEAIKADKYPEIEFTLLANKALISDGHNFNGTLRGNLSVAGYTREIEVPFTGTINEDSTVLVRGSVDLKMTDFRIDPPTALLGTLKTGDIVTVSFSLNLFNKS